ncbi:tetratricopeptide repeat-containing sensor histidine kinase [Sediminitomix flava]|uniref:histidine kinase n=1 Tax=Sediminitomix flava TaxID=379075 RepID=A0A315Z4J5_SEDFL|nr:sensor histidine kinase [Sediminitomix flava]PWJ38004.1 signal transduction histidine kinase [Sediminitomix flava]
MKTSIKAFHLLMGFFCLIIGTVYGQNQRIADSLKIIYEQGYNDDSIRFEHLRKLAFNEVNDLSLSIKYADELIELAKKKENNLYLFRGHHIKGYKLRDFGELDSATDAFINALHAAQKAQFKPGIGTSYSSIADVYKISGNHDVAIQYYKKAIGILRESSDSLTLAGIILNTGDEYLTIQKYDSALLFFEESGELFRKVNYPIGSVYNLGNMGMVYANTGKYTLAQDCINEAIQMLETSEDFYPICFYLLTISDIYKDKEDHANAIQTAKRSLDIAERHGMKQQISDANQKLYELYELKKDDQKALSHYKAHIAFRDSVNNLESVQNLADLRTNFEINLREKEISILEKEQKLDRGYILISLVLLLFAVVLILYFRQNLKNTKLLALSQRKAHERDIENLLNKQETKALQAMLNGSEQERKRIAQDLHNHFGSLMATIKVNVNAIEENQAPNKPTLEKLVNKACNDIRSISHELNMGISENFGLVPAIKELIQHLQVAKDISVELSCSVGDSQLELEDEILIYRVVQELISNALKHAQATKLSVMLTCFEDDELINILIEDNGKGFSPEKIAKKSSGIGLDSLTKMIEERSGELKIDSHPKRGTTISVDLPIHISQVIL